MGLPSTLLERTFGRPTGLLGRLGGRVMARTNADANEWVVSLLDLDPDDDVLEVGFGPGVGIEAAARAVSKGTVAGVDASEEMLDQARRGNAGLVEAERANLRRGTAEALPFGDGTFDAAFALNSVQVWSEPVEGLRELHRALKPGGRVAVAFTTHADPPDDVSSLLADAGFESVRVREREDDVCFLAEA